MNLRATDHPEFDAWRWNEYWIPLEVVIEFKRDVYQMALTELARFLPRAAQHNRYLRSGMRLITATTEHRAAARRAAIEPAAGPGRAETPSCQPCPSQPAVSSQWNGSRTGTSTCLGLAAQVHQVVAVDHLGLAGEAEQALELA